MSPIQVAFHVLRTRTREVRGAIGLAVASTLGAAIATMGTVLVARDAAVVFSAPTWSALNRLVLLLVACYGVRSMGQWISGRASTWAANHLVARLRQDLFDRVIGQRAVELDRMPAGDTAARIVTDALLVREFVLVSGAEIIPSVFVLVLGLGTCITLNPVLAAVALLGIPVVGGGLALFTRKAHDEVLSVQSRMGDLSQELVERLQLGTLIKAFGRESHERARFHGVNHAHLEAAERAARIQTLQTPVVGFLQVVAIAGALWVGGAQILLGKLTVPDLMAFAAALSLCIDPVIFLSNGWSRIQQASAAWMRLAPLLDLAGDVSEPVGAHPNASEEVWSGEVTLQGVSASYVKGIRVVEQLSMAIAPCEYLALVGPSGGGKSTIGRLLVGLLEPCAGYIRWGTSGRIQRQRVGYVPQESLLFSGTIADNIRYGKLDATDAEVREAARLALAMPFIEQLNEGLDTILEARGQNLSGGQRQRLAIARALVGAPALLVLDEPTSALDPASEALVTDTINSLKGRCTMVVVTHRRETIRSADRILTFEAGRLIPDTLASLHRE